MKRADASNERVSFLHSSPPTPQSLKRHGSHRHGYAQNGRKYNGMYGYCLAQAAW